MADDEVDEDLADIGRVLARASKTAIKGPPRKPEPDEEPVNPPAIQ